MPASGVLVLSGYGVRIAVERGHLAVANGIGRERRAGRLARATCKLRRLVVLGHAGTVSLEALRWLHDLGAAFVQVGADGEVIAATAPAGLDDPRLRRAQALAATNGVGLGIARHLLREKLQGQSGVLAQLPDTEAAREAVGRALAELEAAETTERLRLAESQAAAAYWQAWSALPVPWAGKDAERVPDHWRTFGARTSPLTGSPRSAANPANAMLNLLYAILESEARIALLAVGLDPGMGVLHADLKARDSLALDLMEAARPQIDADVLQLLRSHKFAARDFFETRQGACRVLPPLTLLLAETAPAWARDLAPRAEGIARALADAGGVAVPTPLTGTNRSVGREGVRRRETRSRPEAPLAVPPMCRNCGAVLDDPSRAYCNGCLPGRREEAMETFLGAGAAALAKLRIAGRDPAHGGEAARKRGRRNAEQGAAVSAWESRVGDGDIEDVDFARDILPNLQGVSLRALAEATGLTEGYCSFVRRGLKMPHRRHWGVLTKLGSARSEPLAKGTMD